MAFTSFRENVTRLIGPVHTIDGARDLCWTESNRSEIGGVHYPDLSWKL